MNLTVGVIGLGNIGNGVAKNISKKGYKVLGFDIDPNRMDECIAISVNSIEKIASQSHFLLVAVATLEAYEEVMKIISINASDKIYEFMFVGPALPITGAVGSPVNPLAIK